MNRAINNEGKDDDERNDTTTDERRAPRTSR